MAIKGNGYTKTGWSFQERPVSSTKLNQWDDRIEAALELAYFLLNQAWGGGNGVVRGASAMDLRVVATSPASMAVEVKPGYAFISRMPYRLAAAGDLHVTVMPALYPRIDVVQAKLDGWQLSLKHGIEAPSPSAPAVDADCIALARLHLRPGLTCINEADDGVNGYIIDVRTFL